jgi:hypothetical protein
MSAVELLPICLVAAFVIRELPPIVLQLGALAAIAVIGVLICYSTGSREMCYR